MQLALPSNQNLKQLALPPGDALGDLVRYLLNMLDEIVFGPNSGKSLSTIHF